MVTFQKQKRMLALAAVLTALICVPSPARASDDHNSKAKKAAAQSAKAAKVFDEIMQTPDKAIPEDLLKRAKAIVVFPHVVKAAFVAGAEGGSGVVTAQPFERWLHSDE